MQGHNHLHVQEQIVSVIDFWNKSVIYTSETGIESDSVICFLIDYFGNQIDFENENSSCLNIINSKSECQPCVVNYFFSGYESNTIICYWYRYILKYLGEQKFSTEMKLLNYQKRIKLELETWFRPLVRKSISLG